MSRAGYNQLNKYLSSTSLPEWCLTTLSTAVVASTVAVEPALDAAGGGEDRPCFSESCGGISPGLKQQLFGGCVPQGGGELAEVGWWGKVQRWSCSPCTL